MEDWLRRKMRGLKEVCGRVFPSGGDASDSAIARVRQAAERDPEAARFYLRQRITIGDARGTAEFYEKVVLRRHRELVLGPGEQLSLIRMLEFGGHASGLRQSCELFLCRYPVEAGWEEVAVTYARLFLEHSDPESLREPLRHLHRVESKGDDKRWRVEAQKVRGALEMALLLSGTTQGGPVAQEANESSSPAGSGNRVPGLQMRVVSGPKKREVTRGPVLSEGTAGIWEGWEKIGIRHQPGSPLPRSGQADDEPTPVPGLPCRMAALTPIPRVRQDEGGAGQGGSPDYEGSPELIRGPALIKDLSEAGRKPHFEDGSGMYVEPPVAAAGAAGEKAVRSTRRQEQAPAAGESERSSDAIGKKYEGVALQLSSDELVCVTASGQVRLKWSEVVWLHCARVRLSSSSRSDQRVLEILALSGKDGHIQLTLWERTCAHAKCRVDGEAAVAEDCMKYLVEVMSSRVASAALSEGAQAVVQGAAEISAGTYQEYAQALEQELLNRTS